MLAPKYIESDFTLIKYREKVLLLHKHKLRMIKESKQMPSSQSMKKVSHRPFSQIQRDKDIKEQNQKFLKRLAEISHRKTTSPSQSSYRSLNVHNRKREAGRIANENESIARRLSGITSSISQNKLENDYLLHQRCILRMSREKLIKSSLKRNHTPNSIPEATKK